MTPLLRTRAPDKGNCRGSPHTGIGEALFEQIAAMAPAANTPIGQGGCRCSRCGNGRGVRPMRAGATDEAQLPVSALDQLGETYGFFGGFEQRLGLEAALVLLGLRVAVGDNACAGLHVNAAVLDQCGAQHDATVPLSVSGEVADAPRVRAPLLLLQLL